MSIDNQYARLVLGAPRNPTRCGLTIQASRNRMRLTADLVFFQNGAYGYRRRPAPRSPLRAPADRASPPPFADHSASRGLSGRAPTTSTPPDDTRPVLGEKGTATPVRDPQRRTGLYTCRQIDAAIARAMSAVRCRNNGMPDVADDAQARLGDRADAGGRASRSRLHSPPPATQK